MLLVDPPAASSSRGLTMIELLVALCIVSIFSAAVIRMFASFNRSYTTQNVAAGTQQHVRAALDFMARDIRMAGLDPLRTAGAEVITATATTLQFTADKNMDGDLNDAGEDVTYTVTGGSLQLTDDLGTETLTDHVSNLTFTYFDEDGVVDGNDFLTWQSGFGQPSGASHGQGDADADGDVDGDDFLLWQVQFGSGLGNGASAVPEPSSLMLLSMFAVAGLSCRIRRKH